MGRYAVIGLGKFGTAVARTLEDLGHQVIAIERDGGLVDRLAECASKVVEGDATDPAVLKAAGAADVDAAVISTAENLASTILATVALRDLGVTNIYAKAASEAEARALTALGVAEAVIPEQEAGVRLAHRVSSRALLRYLPIAPGYCAVEMAVPEIWRGKSLREVNPRETWQLSVIAVLDKLSDTVTLPPEPAAPLKDSDSILVAGTETAIAKLQKTV